MHHDYDVLGRCKRCGAHKARCAEDEEPCESEADRRAAEVKRLSAALEAAGGQIVELQNDYARVYDALVAEQEHTTRLNGCIVAALAILRTPGTWSDFAQRAIKTLEGK